jgi:hypothetical protein
LFHRIDGNITSCSKSSTFFYFSTFFQNVCHFIQMISNVVLQFVNCMTEDLMATDHHHQHQQVKVVGINIIALGYQIGVLRVVEYRSNISSHITKLNRLI